MTTPYAYRQDQQLPALPVLMLDGITGQPIDFSSGWTFKAKIALKSAPIATIVTKNAGFTGSAGALTPTPLPNLKILFSSDDFTPLTADIGGTEYVIHIEATQAGNKDVYRPAAPLTFMLYPAPS